jgi:hypothetical protein
MWSAQAGAADYFLVVVFFVAGAFLPPMSLLMPFS